MKYDVIIIGGGPAGLACADVLASANGKFPFMEGKKFLVIDNGNSDLTRAEINNVPLVPFKTDGKQLVAQMKEKVFQWENVEIVSDTVTEIVGEKGNFTVKTESGKEYQTDIVVLATGFHKFEIKGLPVKVIPHKKAPRPGKIQLEVNEKKEALPGVYAAGLLAGEQTMLAIALASGTEVALNILSEWAGKTVIVHDAPEE
jgi:thioredoxin reductase